MIKNMLSVPNARVVIIVSSLEKAKMLVRSFGLKPIGWEVKYENGSSLRIHRIDPKTDEDIYHISGSQITNVLYEDVYPDSHINFIKSRVRSGALFLGKLTEESISFNKIYEMSISELNHMNVNSTSLEAK